MVEWMVDLLAVKREAKMVGLMAVWMDVLLVVQMAETTVGQLVPR